MLLRTQKHGTHYSPQLFRIAVLQRVRCRQVRCSLKFYTLQPHCAQRKFAKMQNVSLAPNAYSNCVPPTAIKKVRHKQQFDFCHANGEEVSHNVSLLVYYNFSVPNSQRTMFSSIIKKICDQCVQEYTQTHFMILVINHFDTQNLIL